MATRRTVCYAVADAAIYLTSNMCGRRSDGRAYLGIWYATIPEQTVVWVANRLNPVVRPPGVLTLSADGRLVILDGRNATLWSSDDAAGSGGVATRATAQLLDSGDLVVSHGGESQSGSTARTSVAWESFDYPTDTLLPGVKLGVYGTSGISRNITSWRSAADPSPGAYTFKLVSGGLPEFFLFRGMSKTYASGPWNGAELTGVPNLKSRDFIFQVISNRDETYYTYYVSDPSVLSRFVLNGTTGQVQRFSWHLGGGWSSFWHFPLDPCDSYARCGAFGYCDVGQSPLCSCLPGFRPRSPQRWSVGDGSDGCVRTTNLSCGAGDGFWTVSRMKLPEATSATVHAGLTLDRCRQLCLGNCSCRAYAAADISGGINRGCVIWAVDLIDMRQYSEVVQDVYIRLAQSEVDALTAAANRRSHVVVVIAVMASISGVLLLGAFAFGCLCFWRNRAAPAGSRDNELPLQAIKLKRPRDDQRFSDENKMSGEEDDLDLRLFDLAVILAATDNFAADSKIGQGGFGPVYLGRLEDGQEVAVKRLSRKSAQGVEEFKNEVKLIAKLQHRNLVRLLGCCIDGDERMLVYEFMHNNSLDTFIFGDEEKRKLLRWKTRFEIIAGIARGLLYLHEDSRLRIIHRDMKASNVLLDKNMIPKISDFGIARMFGGDQTTAYTLKAWTLWKEGRSTELLDEVMMDSSCDHSQVRRCIQVALLCVDMHPRNRPLMSSVVMMLATENAMLPEPNEPGGNTGRSTSDGELSQTQKNGNDIHGANFILKVSASKMTQVMGDHWGDRGQFFA
ncbi:Receptor-like serine/threonine-protein kinase SD1-8 [Triticum urartu]|uniref:Receptor-like serine/threonine-protein kinase n=1 Tax=Triticum urartu TaxID=4572 RepID=M7YPH8_TRIUA|nr:Receptor-like serine/threonine-protein kinase SD1-8 [Triticum urartu]